MLEFDQKSVWSPSQFPEFNVVMSQVGIAVSKRRVRPSDDFLRQNWANVSFFPLVHGSRFSDQIENIKTQRCSQKDQQISLCSCNSFLGACNAFRSKHVGNLKSQSFGLSADLGGRTPHNVIYTALVYCMQNDMHSIHKTPG